MPHPPFKKLLIANRGEIAVRIIRACHEMGIAAVAVYSDADRTALHMRMADQAYHIGPAPSRESYLVYENILKAAKDSGAEAIHPGYGFLSENSDFAQLVQDSGLILIGPSPRAIRLMGDKTAARQCMAQAGVPIVPGTDEELHAEAVAEVAAELGYPVLIKAAAGGGGKGMRIVHKNTELDSAYAAAKSEAEAAFGDNRVYIEKYVEAPRHIEFQILADEHGNIVHLGERECSIQRRHQKVIEEAPSCILDAELRTKMGQAAVQAAAACEYSNAGTIEFIFDQDRNFYFLEMNTRLQVEHPVTEMITGVDLVKEQIRIAAGERLSLQQDDVCLNGHAIECRIYAEDPRNGFLPSTGTIAHLTVPSGPGVREDSGFQAGSEVSIYYDPLISKFVVWGQNRAEAIARMRRGLREYRIVGVETSIPFCQLVMEHERFVSGNFDTHFIETEFFSKDPEEIFGQPSETEKRAAMIAAAVFYQYENENALVSDDRYTTNHFSAWKMAGRKA